MREYRLWILVFERALIRAYGIGRSTAFLRFSRRSKPAPGDIIKNPDAYAVAEKMAQDLKESRLWAEEQLRDC